MKLLGAPAGTRLMLLLLVSVIFYSGVQMAAQDKPDLPPKQVVPLHNQEFKISAKSYKLDKKIAKPKEVAATDLSSGSKKDVVSQGKISKSKSSNKAELNKKRKQPRSIVGHIVTDLVRLTRL